jgi:hypothetical protein
MAAKRDAATGFGGWRKGFKERAASLLRFRFARFPPTYRCGAQNATGCAAIMKSCAMVLNAAKPEGKRGDEISGAVRIRRLRLYAGYRAPGASDREVRLHSGFETVDASAITGLRSFQVKSARRCKMLNFAVADLAMCQAIRQT